MDATKPAIKLTEDGLLNTLAKSGCKARTIDVNTSAMKHTEIKLNWKKEG